MEHILRLDKRLTTLSLVLFQSLRADAYDHYSAIYSLLCDRLKRHKNLRIAASPSIPRTMTFPTSANIQVGPARVVFFQPWKDGQAAVGVLSPAAVTICALLENFLCMRGARILG